MAVPIYDIHLNSIPKTNRKSLMEHDFINWSSFDSDVYIRNSIL